MNKTLQPSRSNLDKWISEYPKQRAFIMHPLRVWYFLTHPLPDTEGDDEWDRLMTAISEYQSPESEKSTGEKWSPNSTNFPLEPPF